MLKNQKNYLKCIFYPIFSDKVIFILQGSRHRLLTVFQDKERVFSSNAAKLSTVWPENLQK